MPFRFYYILFTIIVLALWGCDSSDSKTGELIDFIPENASVVFNISNFETFKTDLKNSNLLSQLNSNKLHRFFSEENSFLKKINISEKSLLSIHGLSDSIQAYTWITKYDPLSLQLDSIPELTSEIKTYNKHDYQELHTEELTNFAAVIDSIFILSSSVNNLQNIIDGKTLKDASTRKLYNIKESNDLTLLFRLDEADSSNFASEMVLDLALNPGSISGSGVMVARDTLPQLLDVFRGLIPQQNNMAQIIPASAKNAVILTFDDAGIITKNLRDFKGDSTELNVHSMFGSLSELAEIHFANDTVVAAKSIDPELTQDAIAASISEEKRFREVMIYSFSNSDILEETFAPLVKIKLVRFAFEVDGFFVFTASEKMAEQMISAYKSSATLAKTPYFEQASLELSTASSLVFYEMQGDFMNSVSKVLPASFISGSNKTKIKEYPFAALQLSYDRDFAHLNLICSENSKVKNEIGSISEQFSISLENNIMGRPKLFTNHRTKGKDVVVQDIENRLYLISSNGKILWKKKLDGAVLGEVNEIDLLRNGKKQLAFTTKKAFHVLDRNGKAVAPFPMEFKDDITQPLAIFDYDNNRKYRFLITQGEDIYMYDSKAKIVSGFTYKKADSKIMLPPQHIRMNNKDYLLVAEENGKLNILSRVGKQRIDVKKKFEFSKLPIAREGSSFVVITKNKTKESISQAGKVSSVPLSVSDTYGFTVRGSTKVTLDDNLLRINGKLVELPFGIYTKPTITIVNRKTYIAVTEIQDNKVYLYDRSGNIINGFPVYGSSMPDVADANKNGKPNLVVKGGNKEVIFYNLN